MLPRRTADHAPFVLITAAVIAGWPIAAAAASPLLGGRDVIWIIGGMAGIFALSLLFIQPQLMISRANRKRIVVWHRIVGLLIGGAVLLHVACLYIYSPDDILDALLLAAPTSFSVYGAQRQSK